MAKNKNPKIDGDDEPRRIGDATEIDLNLKAEDEIPPELASEAGGLDFDLLKPAGSMSRGFSDLENDQPRVGDRTEATFEELNLDLLAASAVDSGVKLEAVSPVQPASGWFDDVEEAPKIVSTDAIEAAMAQPASGVVDGSDIFAGPVPAAMPKSDVSDVIAATAYSPAKPVGGERKKPPASRASDVALNFDRPPGGSTVESISALAGLPVAEEAPDSLFGEEPAKDSPDFGASPASSMDASSILADLSEPGSFPGDSSAIRLEAPGMDATMRPASDPPKFSRESTELDMDLPDAEEADSTDWRSQTGSDLFGTRPEFELTPDSGKIDPFADELDVDQPSLSSAPSSIFSGLKPPARGSAPPSSGNVPVANPESSADAVEFSDHPDPNAADSGSFHVLPAGAAGAVDFDMPESELAHPERSMMAHIPEDDDWSNAKTDPGTSSSGMLGRRKKLDPTDEMAPIPATPVKGKAGKKAEAAKVVAWADETEEMERAEPKRRDPQPEQSNKRGLAGLALGLLLGVGASAGAYFSGALPNKEGAASSGSTVQASPELQSKYDAATAELKTKQGLLDASDKKLVAADGDVKAAKENALKVEGELKGLLATQTKLAADLKGTNDTLAADVKAEKEKTLQAIKDGAADKDKVAVLQKDLTNEKDKVIKADKDLLAEKDKLVKLDKDYKATLDKVAADAKKDLDVAKADLIKAQDTLKAETTDKAKLADAVKAKQATVDAIAKELQAGKLLPDKFDDATLLAAAKSSVSRATGPDLSKLIPADMSAVAGTGLSTGHILDLASRTNKSEAATKAAATEIAKLKTDRDSDIKLATDGLKKNLADQKDAYAVDLKKVADTAAADMKKAADANAVATDKLKADLKKAADATAIEVKKANDAAAVAMDKLKAEQIAKSKEDADAHAAQMKSLEGAVTAEKVKTAEAERRFKALGGGTSLASQELDRVAVLTSARNRDAGIAAYKSGRYAAAVEALEEAAKHDPNDPLAWYFLGATRWAQGKTDEAKADYKKGAEREALRIVSTKEIDGMIGAIQGPARDALGAARP